MLNIHTREAGHKLIITCDDESAEQLKEEMADHPDDWIVRLESDVIEAITANSAYLSISPMMTGDLLGDDCPMLGEFGEDRVATLKDKKALNKPGSCLLHVGQGPDPATGKLQTWVCPLLNRWAYMDYQVRSFVEDLVEKKQAIFVSEC